MRKLFLSIGIASSFMIPAQAALAARCSLGQIYRPSRGVCVFKSQAVASGIYGTSARHHAKRQSEAPAVAEKSSPVRSMIVATSTPNVLAYDGETPVRKPQAFKLRLDALPRAQPGTPLSRAPSPYGGLVALEPAP
ncbi:MAG: hypothetical protein JWM36_1908 [Hyphomicrobiales bacterium]|nr:hypothetical protein [Hyphomicrobiales bacterium]